MKYLYMLVVVMGINSLQLEMTPVMYHLVLGFTVLNGISIVGVYINEAVQELKKFILSREK